ncbi:hypothetical protein HYX07_04965 [Candidatus Woesearchaeota archaeon]|nr:hypothetical protein [Candidatus Woesearchaeota archaeon]
MNRKLEEKLASSLNELFSGKSFPLSFYLGRSIVRGFEEYLDGLGFNFTGFASAGGIFKSGFLLNFANDGFYPGRLSKAVPCNYEDIRNLKKTAKRSFTFEPGTEEIPTLREISERGVAIGYYLMRQALNDDAGSDVHSARKGSVIGKVFETYKNLSDLVCDIVTGKNLELLKYARKRSAG